MSLLSWKKKSYFFVSINFFYSSFCFSTLIDLENPPLATVISTPRDGRPIPLAQVVPLAEVIIDSSLESQREDEISREDSCNQSQTFPSITAKESFFYNIQHGRLRKVARSTYFTLINHLEDKSGRSPLHVAVQNNQLEIVKLLLSVKANPYKKDPLENIPLYYAKKLQYKEIEKALKKAGKKNYRKIHKDFWKEGPQNERLPQV